jgi:MFS family permease
LFESRSTDDNLPGKFVSDRSTRGTSQAVPTPGGPAPVPPAAGPEPGPPSAPPRGGALAHMLRALRHRNYRLFFGGQGISLVGTWMQSVALSWLVYRLTGSAVLLGTVGFIGQIPTLVLGPLAGVIADRAPLRAMLIGTQTAALIQASVLAVLTLNGWITVGQILALSLAAGLINAFDMPTRQAFVVEMVTDPADLGNAIALNSFLVNGARLIGPSLAGLLIAALGEGLCFLLNALSYVAVIAALLAMTATRRRAPADTQPLLAGLRSGFAYAFGVPPIRALLLLLALTSLMGMSYATVLPVFAKEVLLGDARTLGFLLGGAGVGALVGAVYMMSRKSAIGLGRIVAAGSAIFGVALIAVAQTRTLPAALPLMVLLGLGMMLQIVATNTSLQSMADDDKRGRLMALYSMAFLGMTPFGSLVAGALTHRLGAPTTIAIGGACCMVGALVFWACLPQLRPVARELYIRKGLLTPEPET